MKKKIVIIGIFFIIIDQLIKQFLVVNNIIYNQVISVIPDFFYLTYVKNTGGAFSILSNNTIFLVLIGFMCIVVFFHYIKNKQTFNNLEIAYLSMILGGIIGNLIDRVFFNGVVDYLGFIFGNYYFPIFNFADILIVIGVGLFILNELKGDTNVKYR